MAWTAPAKYRLSGSAQSFGNRRAGGPWMLVATTSAVVASGDTLVFTYKNVTAPSTLKWQLRPSRRLLRRFRRRVFLVAIAAQPTPIIVREVVTAIAIEADDSFFAGESLSGMVTLWGAVRQQPTPWAMWSSRWSRDSETGSFAAESITIGDDMQLAQPSPTTTLRPVRLP